MAAALGFDQPGVWINFICSCVCHSVWAGVCSSSLGVKAKQTCLHFIHFVVLCTRNNSKRKPFSWLFVFSLGMWWSVDCCSVKLHVPAHSTLSVASLFDLAVPTKIYYVRSSKLWYACSRLSNCVATSAACALGIHATTGSGIRIKNKKKPASSGHDLLNPFLICPKRHLPWKLLELSRTVVISCEEAMWSAQLSLCMQL